MKMHMTCLSLLCSQCQSVTDSDTYTHTDITTNKDFSVYFNLGPGSGGIGNFLSFLKVSLGVFTIVINLQTVALHGSTGTLNLFVHY